jgi:hypothetical protein
MPSIQSKAINVMLHLMRMKRTVNRMRQRVEIGERTYTEPSPRLHRKHQISKRELNGHLVWTIAPKEKPSGKLPAWRRVRQQLRPAALGLDVEAGPGCELHRHCSQLPTRA